MFEVKARCSCVIHNVNEDIRFFFFFLNKKSQTMKKNSTLDQLPTYK